MRTSFRNIFRQGDVAHIEIPIIQRDYAQGREDVGVKRIRKAFLKVLHSALTGGAPVGLDFVYGDVENERLIPLDGQQRLTTLFLLHWYLAARGEVDHQDCEFLSRFTYKTRFSARHFCEKLVAHRPPFPSSIEGKKANPCWLSAWLKDQHWHAGAWKYDPTIQSMLVALDDIHELFSELGSEECKDAWNLLVAENTPAITFDFLPIEQLGLSDELYIKMNSRGKPLTAFEHFKADFEKTLNDVSEKSRETFVSKIDQEWSDLLWPLRDSKREEEDLNKVIDDEFLRLFHFIGDIFIARNGLDVEGGLFKDDIDRWAEEIFGAANSKDPMKAHEYLFKVLDGFVLEFGKMQRAAEISAWFDERFTDSVYSKGKVAIFGDIDLLADCCANYGKLHGKTRRVFTLSRTLLLFAVTEYLISENRPEPEVISDRLRVLRNVLLASDDEIRPNNFSALLNETAEYIATGDPDKLQTFYDEQVDEEKAKTQLLLANPNHLQLKNKLHRLEDHELLRGRLSVFDLTVDADTFVRRADAFQQIFSADPPYLEISAALLASGDYSQHPRRNDRYQLGSPERSRVWLELLTARKIANTREALMKMLDDFGASSGTCVIERLKAVANGFLARRLASKQLDWRYYLVKYPKMRSGESGLYATASNAMGFDLCMMKETQLNGAYRDPYLLAVIVQSGAKEGTDVAELKHYGWDFFESDKRWIELVGTGERIMSCRQDGYELHPPSSPENLSKFKELISNYNVTNNGGSFMLQVPQVLTNGVIYDQEDRIEIASGLLKKILLERFT